MNQPPVEVYQGLFELNKSLLIQELESNVKNMPMIYERFNRMIHALDYVENYKMQKAREGKL